MCEHGDVNGCCDMEKFFIFMPLAVSDFTAGSWSDPGIARDTKLLWLRETLEGIKTLHAMGIMHRDIRPKNMLILSIKPARAALCDYGKATDEETSTITTLGPIPTLAPEVWTVPAKGPYTAKIDMWAYGYAIAEIWVILPINTLAQTALALTSRLVDSQRFSGCSVITAKPHLKTSH